MLGAYTILSSMDRVKFLFTYKLTNEGYESNKILSNMNISCYLLGLRDTGGGVYFAQSSKDRVKILLLTKRLQKAMKKPNTIRHDGW